MSATSSKIQLKTEDTLRKKVLHVGCGRAERHAIPSLFTQVFGDFEEIRLDINPDINPRPDIIGDIRDLKDVESETIDGLFSSHNIEHLYTHEVIGALKSFYRVLKPGGIAYISCPDIQTVAEEIVKGNLEGPLYISSSGPVSAQDTIYGHIAAIANGEYGMAHKTSFTALTLARKLFHAGFRAIQILRRPYTLNSVSQKILSPTEEQMRTVIYPINEEFPKLDTIEGTIVV